MSQTGNCKSCRSPEDVREFERARIAQELHDELGQSLTGIRLEVSWLGGRLLPEQQLLAGRVSVIKTQIDHTIALSARFRPNSDRWFSTILALAAAAAWYIDQFSERTGLPVDLVLPDEDPNAGRRRLRRCSGFCRNR